MDPSSTPTRGRSSARADAWYVAIGVAAVATVAIAFELSERLYALTRPFEHAQLDELPLVLLALSAGLAWYARRRIVDAYREASARRAAESQLTAALEDLRRLARERLSAQEDERRNVARDLHDDLGQSLTALKLDATLLAGALAPGRTRELADGVLHGVERLHASVRDLISRLRPVALDELGLAAAIEHLAGQWQQRAGACDLLVTLDGAVDALDADRALTVYRVVQEGLTNAFRHSAASRVEATIRMRADATGAGVVRVLIEDDGRGDPQVRPGFGLRGMRERVESAGGTLRLSSAEPTGFVLEAELPLGASA